MRLLRWFILSMPALVCLTCVIVGWHSYTGATFGLLFSATGLFGILWTWAMLATMSMPGSPWHPSGVAIYAVGDYEWFAAHSPREAEDFARSYWSDQGCLEEYSEDGFPHAVRLTPEQLDTLRYVDENGAKRSYRGELARRLKGHEAFPQFFATTEI